MRPGAAPVLDSANLEGLESGKLELLPRIAPDVEEGESRLDVGLSGPLPEAGQGTCRCSI